MGMHFVVHPYVQEPNAYNVIIILGLTGAMLHHFFYSDNKKINKQKQLNAMYETNSEKMLELTSCNDAYYHGMLKAHWTVFNLQILL